MSRRFLFPLQPVTGSPERQPLFLPQPGAGSPSKEEGPLPCTIP